MIFPSPRRLPGSHPASVALTACFSRRSLILKEPVGLGGGFVSGSTDEVESSPGSKGARPLSPNTRCPSSQAPEEET